MVFSMMLSEAVFLLFFFGCGAAGLLLVVSFSGPIAKLMMVLSH